MKNKIRYFSSIVLVLTYVSCSKISDTLQMDIVVTDTISFEVPIITNFTDTVFISNIEGSVNFADQLNDQKRALSISNLKNVKLKSFDLDLISESSVVDTANTFGKLQFIKLQIPDGVKSDSLARINITSSAISTSLALTPVISPETLKRHVTGPPLSYKLSIKAKSQTTSKLKVKGTAIYIATLIK